MDLVGSKAGAKGKKSKKKAANPAAKKQKISKPVRAPVKEVDVEQEEVIRAGDNVQEPEAEKAATPKVQLVPPFADGLVNRVFEKAVPAIIKRPVEESLFDIGVQDLVRESHTFAGDISVRTSFVTHKREGGMLI